MAVNLSPVGGVAAQFFDNSGNVLTGGKLYSYAAGTTTPVTTYTSSQANVAWSNPIVLDAAGRVSGSGEIWLTDGIIYKFVLKDTNDVLIATYDNITGINSNSVSYTNQQEIVTATAGQTVFNLGISYQPATNSLSVFVDGVNQYGPGAQYSYVETDENTVTFNAGLHVGAEVKFTTTQQQGAGAVDASQVSYTPPYTGAVPTNVQIKLSETVSVQDFGAVGDGVTDDAAAIQAAFDSGARVVTFGQGGSFYLSTGINIAVDSDLEKIIGPATLLCDFNGPDYPGSVFAFDSDKAIWVDGITFIAQDPNYTTTITAADGSDWSYSVRLYCGGVQSVEGTKLFNCSFQHFYGGIRIDGTFSDDVHSVVKDCETIECAGGPDGVPTNINFYGCSNVIIDGHYAYKGGEITLPSNKRITFVNSIILLPNTPAIDVGGSGASGYETEEVIITNNTSYGRDPIVCEGGAYRVVIANNVCVGTMVTPYGVGIGVTSQLNNGQAVSEITVTGNIIRLIGDAANSSDMRMASGISIRNLSTDPVFSSVAQKITIANNSINTNVFYGMLLQSTTFGAEAYLKNMSITGNRINSSYYGIVVEYAQYVHAYGNDIYFTNNAMLVKKVADFVIQGNRTTASGSGAPHYRLDDLYDGNNQLYITGTNATSDADAVEIVNIGSDAALPYLESNVPGNYVGFRVKFGSTVRLNPTPGGFFGQVCTTGTTSSTVWKTYGAISA